MICSGQCEREDLSAFANENLKWFWEQIARAADRRGDDQMVTGTIGIRVPRGAHERAAAVGVLGPGILRPGQLRKLDLSELKHKLRVRGSNITPGFVAAHIVNRKLAAKAHAKGERRKKEDSLKKFFINMFESHVVDTESAWAALRRAGLVARLAKQGQPEPLVHMAAEILRKLPKDGSRIDRRKLASDVVGDPHGLDDGFFLPRLVLGILIADGRISRQPSRSAWSAVGIDCDDVTGGLISVGFLPEGWHIPKGSVLTIPPRVLAACKWPKPDKVGDWVFVTENPSVASAAADLCATETKVRLLCTNGTPSQKEIQAISEIAKMGWRIAVRADFDPSGINHVAAVLRACTEAIPWRMAASNYIESLKATEHDGVNLLEPIRVPWDLQLEREMRSRAVPAFEEALLPILLYDIKVGVPGDSLSI